MYVIQILDNVESPFAAVLALIDRSNHMFDLCDADAFITAVLHPDMKANLDWVVPTLGDLLTLNAQFQVAQPFCDVLFYLARLMAIDHTHAVRARVRCAVMSVWFTGGPASTVVGVNSCLPFSVTIYFYFLFF